ncbi:hypothetical protein [Saccharophagus sp. K07]|uniref:hypothetical protein n=1 Tax=Saccharophagus sp. K07 TaxID=2283636 RepID=UPI001651DF65|nr:hypothetical protein [Saccharophagus sp. K07]
MSLPTMKQLIKSVLIPVCSVALMIDAAAAPRTPTITDQLLAVLLERHLPEPMYEQASNPWPGGDYSLQVQKAGRPEVTSSETNIHVKIPLKVLISGKVANDMLQIKLACSSSFTSIGEIVFTPAKPGVITTLTSAITLPVPPTTANCEGLQFPIDDYLKTVIAQNKRQWELKLDAELKDMLQEKPAQESLPKSKSAATPQQ